MTHGTATAFVVDDEEKKNGLMDKKISLVTTDNKSLDTSKLSLAEWYKYYDNIPDFINKPRLL